MSWQHAGIELELELDTGIAVCPTEEQAKSSSAGIGALYDTLRYQPLAPALGIISSSGTW